MSLSAALLVLAGCASSSSGGRVITEKEPVPAGGMAAVARNLTYPDMCRQAGIEGNVVLAVTVDAEGDVTDAKVTRGIGGGCDEAAVEAVRRTPFQPATVDGRPVAGTTSLKVSFKLPPKN